MNRPEYVQFFKRLLDHPKFEQLPERDQAILYDIAFGLTLYEIAKEYKVSRARIWQWRNIAFGRLGYKVFKGRSIRPMTVTEIRQTILDKKRKKS